MSGAWAWACDSKDVPRDSLDFAGLAVVNLGQALLCHGPEAIARVEYAGANIRAWRKSLPVKVEPRRPDLEQTTGDDLLWRALGDLHFAREMPEVREYRLRRAEAALRTWWKQQQEVPS